MQIIIGFVSLRKIYNNSQHAWDKVRLHLQGIWHNANTSLDLIQLHKEIQGLRDAEPLKFDAAKTAADILEQLRRSLPSWSSFTHLAIVLLVLGLCIIVGLCLFPPLLKYLFRSLLKARAEIHELRLRARP